MKRRAPIEVGACHGVNMTRLERMRYGGEWADTLCAAAGADAFNVTPIPWPSTGSAVGDGFGLFWDPRARQVAQGAVMQGLERFLAQSDGRGVVVGHSFGSVLAPLAFRALGVRPRLVGIGSPATHPVIGRRLAWSGFLRASSARRPPPTTLQNRDDGICALRILGARFSIESTAYGAEWIDVDAQPVGWAREHGADLYLSHPAALRLIENAARE